MSDIVRGGGIAVGLALAAVAGLVALAKPRDFEARVAQVEAQTAEAATLLAGRSGTKAYPAGAVCPEASPAEAAKLQAQLAQALGAAQLEPARLEIQPGAASRGLAPLAFEVEAGGSYEAAMAGLQQLSALRPMVIVDTADLVSRTSSVTLAISGRVYCSAP
jgi:hypothetical protein